MFGLCLLNDWSARDIQAWEYQPLGPFLSKNFATTISPWVVTLEALAPYRLPWLRPADDPQPLPYLDGERRREGAFDIHLEVLLETAGDARARSAAAPAVQFEFRTRTGLWRRWWPTTRSTGAISSRAICWAPARNRARSRRRPARCSS